MPVIDEVGIFKCHLCESEFKNKTMDIEGLIRDFSRHPIVEFRSTLPQLASDAPIINNPDFENGTIKIQDGLESLLTTDEQDGVQRFLKPVVLEDAVEIENLTYAERTLQRKRQKAFGK